MSCPGYTDITTVYRVTTDGKTRRLPEKSQRYKEATWQIGRAEMGYTPDFYRRLGSLLMEQLQGQRLPSPGPVPGRPVFRNLLIWGTSRELWEIEPPLLKGAPTSHTLGCGAEQSFEKRLGQTHCLLETERRKQPFALGTQTLSVATLGLIPSQGH